MSGRTQQARFDTPRAIVVALLLTACGQAEEQHSVGADLQPLEQGSTQPAPAVVAVAAAPVSTAAESPAEISARQAIAHERVEELDAAKQREHRKAEKAALRAALQIKRALLAQAEAGRPTSASAERDLLDQKISGLKANVDASATKLKALEALPD